MGYAYYERLSALDATFLEIEGQHAHMHVGAVSLFEGGPLVGQDGALDIERIERAIRNTLHRTPRFRQRLAWIPGFGHPVWVDDDQFRLKYHVRHASLPHPGDERQLKRLAGRILSQQLDRGKPLWELWFVEGLPERRFAVISKVHHCLIDGISGADLLGEMLRGDEDPSAAPRKPWLPRPAPSATRLLRDELLRRARLPARVTEAPLRGLVHPRATWNEARDTLLGLAEALGAGLKPASPTCLNAEIGPHRRFDWTRLDLAAIREVKGRVGGTVNDVVLATVAGSMRRFLHQRGEAVGDLDFRALIPVSTRRPRERGRLGNRVALLLAPLPLDEPDPVHRLHRVIETTRGLKASRQVRGAELLEELGEWTASRLLVELSRLESRVRAYNIVVTNVPGPRQTVGMLGASLREIYPVVPLFVNQGIGIALFSYAGNVFWGFHADWDTVPDLHDLVQDVEEEFERLYKASARAKV